MSGIAERWLLDETIDRVIAACVASADGDSVVRIERERGISREYVSRTIGHRVIHLVIRRVLALGRRTPVAHESPEVNGRKTA